MRKCLFVLIALAAFVATQWVNGDPRPVYAQAESCETLKESFRQAIDRCFEINGNYVCYGGPVAQVEPVEYRFYNLTDRRPLPDLDNINLEEEGVVILDMHVPGEQEIVRAVTFGSVDVNTIDPRKHIFTMRKIDDGFVCTATPPGMVIRTEPGKAGQFAVNGVTIRLKSSAFVTMEQDNVMVVVNLEGEVELDNGVDVVELPRGFQLRVDLSGTPRFLLPATPSPFFDSDALQWLITDPQGMKRIRNTNEDPTAEAACVRDIDFDSGPIAEQNISGGHECLFRFCARQGDQVTITMDASDPTYDPWVDLRAPDQSLLAFNNDVDGENNSSMLCNVGLPVDGCYTIVARSHRNLQAGPFTVSLQRRTACQPAEPRCIVATPRGLTIHAGPGEDFAARGEIPQNTNVLPVVFSPDKRWLRILVLASGEDGWIPAQDNLVQCEIPTINKLIDPECVYEPQHLPPEDRDDYCDPPANGNGDPGPPATPAPLKPAPLKNVIGPR